MKRFLLFGLFHFVGGILLTLGTFGLIADFLCYLFGKEILFAVAGLLWLCCVGIAVELIGITIFAFTKE